MPTDVANTLDEGIHHFHLTLLLFAPYIQFLPPPSIGNFSDFYCKLTSSCLSVNTILHTPLMSGVCLPYNVLKIH